MSHSDIRLIRQCQYPFAVIDIGQSCCWFSVIPIPDGGRYTYPESQEVSGSFFVQKEV